MERKEKKIVGHWRGQFIKPSKMPSRRESCLSATSRVQAYPGQLNNTKENDIFNCKQRSKLREALLGQELKVCTQIAKAVEPILTLSILIKNSNLTKDYTS